MVGLQRKVLTLNLLAVLSFFFFAQNSSASDRTKSCDEILVRATVELKELPPLPAPHEVNLHEPPATISGITDAIVAAIIKDGKLLMGQRGGEIGFGAWGILGGKVDPGESLLNGLIRELYEEIGINKLLSSQVVYVHYHYAPEKNKWFRVFVVKANLSHYDEPYIQSPREILDLQWFDLDNLPNPIFSQLHEYLHTLH